MGILWERFGLEEICRFYDTDPQDCYFWASHNKAKLDLMILKNGQKIGFEFKYQDAPKMTPSMKIATETLELDELHVVGLETFSIFRTFSIDFLQHQMREGF